MNIRVAICDDIPADAAYIRGLVHTWADRAGHAVRVDTFSSAERFLFA